MLHNLTNVINNDHGLGIQCPFERRGAAAEMSLEHAGLQIRNYSHAGLFFCTGGMVTVAAVQGQNKIHHEARDTFRRGDDRFVHSPIYDSEHAPSRHEPTTLTQHVCAIPFTPVLW